jgi:hypothetical protein
MQAGRGRAYHAGALPSDAVRPCIATCIATAAHPKSPCNMRGSHQLDVTVSRAPSDRAFSLSMRRLCVTQELLSCCGKILHNNYNIEITPTNQILAYPDSIAFYRPMLIDTKFWRHGPNPLQYSHQRTNTSRRPYCITSAPSPSPPSQVPRHRPFARKRTNGRRMSRKTDSRPWGCAHAIPWERTATSNSKRRRGGQRYQSVGPVSADIWKISWRFGMGHFGRLELRFACDDTTNRIASSGATPWSWKGSGAARHPAEPDPCGQSCGISNSAGPCQQR